MVIDNRIKSLVQFHDLLHRFCVERGTETAVVELKPFHDLVSVEQNPIVLTSLDLSKVYDNIDWGRLLQNIKGYGAGPKLQG